jgi:tetratricopeptide (TPR) repeat protein
MKKKDWLYILGFVVIFVAVVLVFGPGTDKNSDEIPAESVSSTTEDGTDEILEDDVAIDPRYFDLLGEARDLAFDGEYQAALQKISDASAYHANFQLEVTRATVYELMGDYEKQKDALYKVIYEYNILEARYWRDYAHALIQTGARVSLIRKAYEDGIDRIEPVAQTIGLGNLIDMYTGYAGYLAGNGFAEDAITYLQKVLVINPERADIYNAEIRQLQEQL